MAGRKLRDGVAVPEDLDAVNTHAALLGIVVYEADEVVTLAHPLVLKTPRQELPCLTGTDDEDAGTGRGSVPFQCPQAPSEASPDALTVPDSDKTDEGKEAHQPDDAERDRTLAGPEEVDQDQQDSAGPGGGDDDDYFARGGVAPDAVIEAEEMINPEAERKSRNKVTKISEARGHLVPRVAFQAIEGTKQSSTASYNNK